MYYYARDVIASPPPPSRRTDRRTRKRAHTDDLPDANIHRFSLCPTTSLKTDLARVSVANSTDWRIASIHRARRLSLVAPPLSGRSFVKRHRGNEEHGTRTGKPDGHADSRFHVSLRCSADRTVSEIFEKLQRAFVSLPCSVRWQTLKDNSLY